MSLFFFFFNDTATTEIYTLSLHDALPICLFSATSSSENCNAMALLCCPITHSRLEWRNLKRRSEEHTSELQSRQYLVCRLLLEKKKKKNTRIDGCVIHFPIHKWSFSCIKV